MKCEALKIRSFLEKATMNFGIKEVGMKFEEIGLVIRAQSAGIAASFSLLKKEAFEEYAPIEGIVGITDIAQLSKMIGTFPKNINLKVSDGKLNIYNSEGKSVSYPIVTDKSYVEGFLEEDMPQLAKFDGGAVIETAALKKAGTNISIIKGEEIKLAIKEGKLSVTTQTSDGKKMTEPTKCDYKDCSGDYGLLLLDSINVLDKEVNIAFMQDADGPILFRMKSPEYDVKHLIAPIVKEDEDTKEVKEETKE